MSVWKERTDARLDRLERNHELRWQAERIADLERLIGELRSVAFPAVAREYLGKRVLHVAESMTNDELFAAVRDDIESRGAA